MTTPPPLGPQLFPGMSHEIRTPMNTVIGLCHLLARSELTPLQREYVAKVQAAGQQLLGIFEEMLDLSRLEAGNLVLADDDFALESLLGNVAQNLHESAGVDAVELVLEVDPSLPARLRGDAVRLAQMASRLAFHAMRGVVGGELAICASEVSREADTVLVRFEVAGGGLAARARDDATPLAQALAATRRLAELMGGAAGHDTGSYGPRLWFTARLKVARQAAFELHPDLRGCRVLVVDDSFEARAAVADMLTGMSLDVAEARDGFEAVEIVRQAAQNGRPFDIAYVDCRMPGLDGFQTIGRIRSLGLDRAPAVVMVSAFAREELMRRAEQLSIENVLVKPLRPSVLFDATMEVLARRRGLRVEPREAAPGEPAALPPPELRAVRGARVLVVEDNDVNQIVARAVLEEAGVEVDIAADGRIALDKLADSQYDLVFMDMQMPVLDGPAATRELRARGIDCPVVAMTANAQERDRHECLEAGMNDVLTKPVDPARVWQQLLRWIAPRAQAEAAAESGPRATSGRMQAGRFIERHAGVPQSIRSALANGDVAQAELLAGTVKCTALDLQLTPLCEAAGNLERALRRYEPPLTVQQRLDALERCMEEAIASIARRDQATTETSTG